MLLRRGAEHVVAVDVGHDQIVESLRADPRVDVREGVNVRSLTRGDIDPAPTLVVADLSFISLTLVLPALADVATPDADLLLMVKPQFEVGRERLGSGGVVRAPDLWVESVVGVADAAAGWGSPSRRSCAARCRVRAGTWSSSCGCVVRMRPRVSTPSASARRSLPRGSDEPTRSGGDARGP